MRRAVPVIVIVCGLLLAVFLLRPVLAPRFRSVEKLLSEEGEDQFGANVTKYLVSEIGAGADLPPEIRVIRGRRDPMDGAPTWAVYAASKDDWNRLKELITLQYQRRRDGAPFTIDDADTAPDGRPAEALILPNCPSWWSVRKIQNPDIFTVRGKGTWTFFVYSSLDEQLYYHHATY